jgi:Protein of unknown function (DUF3828)
MRALMSPMLRNGIPFRVTATRMIRRAAFLLALGAALPATAQTSNHADAFVIGLYDAYARDPGPDYAGAGAKSVFSSKLLDLLHRDAALTPPGEVGALDGDPICDCQDYRIAEVRVRISGSPDVATAAVAFTNYGQPRSLTLDLVREPGGWRVADVHSETLPSLAGLLTDSVAAHSAKAKSPDSRPH